MENSGRARVALVLAAMALVLLIFAALSGTRWFTPADREDTIRGICAAGGVLLLLIAALCIVSDKPPKENPPGSPQGSTLEEWLFDLQAVVDRSVFAQDQASVLSFINLLTQPYRYRSRVAETVDLARGYIRQRVSVEFTLPDSVNKSTVQYIPIMSPRKGELLDDFKLTDASDTTLTNLSYEETTHLIAVALRSLIVALLGQNYQQWSSRTKDAEFVLLSIVTSRGPAEIGHQYRRIERTIDRINGRLSEPARAIIRNYVSLLSASYPVVAVVANDAVVANRVLLKYERTVVPSASAGRFSGSVRMGFKLKPREVVVPLNLALTAASFHLRINAPQEKYLYKQIIRCRQCKQRLTHAWRGLWLADSVPYDSCYHQIDTAPAEDCHYHVERKRGQNFLHLYMRGYGAQQRPLRNLEAMAIFKEMPPGTRGAASVTALATTVFIWAAGYLISHGKVISNSDVPALLLALPAVGASYFGFTSDGDSIVGSSLLARISFVASGVLSVVAIIVYVLQVPDIAHSRTPGLAFAGLGVPIWVVLFALSAVNSLYITWRFMRKLRYYAMLINRPDVIDEGYRSR